MDFIASKVMEGREQWLSSSTTTTQVAISSIEAPTIEPLVLRRDGVVFWDGRLLQSGSCGTRRLEGLIREFLNAAARPKVLGWEFDVETQKMVPTDIEYPSHFSLI